MFGKKEASYQV